MPLVAQGSEHLVYARTSTQKVVKLTRPGVYGDYYFLEDGKMAQRNSTPSEYLVRLRLVTKYFGLPWSLLGWTAQGQFVTQQQFIIGEPPFQKEVDRFLSDSGFVPVRQQFWLWKGAAVRGVEPWLGDTRADNFVRTPHGLVPIDVRMWNVAVLT